AKKYGIDIEEKELSEEGKRAASEREAMMSLNIFASNYFASQLTETAEGRNVGLAYFRERGFNDVTIRKFGLGYCPSSGDAFSGAAIRGGHKEQYLISTGLTIKREQGGYYDRFTGRVIFPITTFTGRIIGFGGRTMRSDKKVAKYLNSPESEIYHKSDTLYGISQSKRAISQADKAILVEGYTDVISMHQSGIENVVASSGTSLTQGQVHLIQKLTKNVTVIYDGDSAGIKASLRGIDIILKEGLNVRVVRLPDGDDPDSFARSLTAEELFAFIDENEVDFITFKSKLLMEEAKDDPIGRARVISDVVGSVSVIDDDIVRSQYVKECSVLLDCDIDLVKSEVGKLRAFAINGTAGREVEVNKLKKQAFLKEPSSVLSTVDIRDQRLYTFEKELVSYILLYGSHNFFYKVEGEQEPVNVNVAELIFDELEVDNIELLYPTYSTVYNLYKELRENVKEGEDVQIDKFINHSKEDVVSFVVDVLSRSEKYIPSKLWAKLDFPVISEEGSLNMAVPKAIELYKRHIIENMIKILYAKLQYLSESESVKELLNFATLKQTSKIICEKYDRIM
ncbi:MAG: DNA primase, partial [Rikenellaceae bacterium]